MNKRVFIVDDEPGLIKIAKAYLETDKFVVASDTDPVSALRKIRQDPPDLVLLDICMDEMSGLEVCREIKADPKISHVPIVMVSVKADEPDVVVGLEMGADDYIRKPLKQHELLARVRAVLRRKGGPDSSAQIIKSGPFQLDYNAYKASANGEPLQLTPKQFELLGLFLRNEGRVLTRGFISERIWGADLSASSRNVDNTVDKLRKQVGAYRDCFKNLKGVGYRFEFED